MLAHDIAGSLPLRTGSSTATRSVSLATLGNLLEWFDFTVYGFVVAILARNFFPSENETAAMLAAFAVFGAGFVARPLGAVAFGRLADMVGRKFVLLLAMLLMAGASLLIGLTPTYATVGIAAPVLIVIARLAQGLSAGAEYGGAAAFLIEWAPPKRRGLFGSFHQVGTYGGLLLGSGTVAILSTLLTAQQMGDWGWRIPFIFGGGLALVALYMRRHIEETPRFQHRAAAAVNDRPAPSALVAVLQSVGIVTLWTVTAFAATVYMTTYTQRFGGLTPTQALWSTAIATAVTVSLIPVAGALSDRFGRRLMLAASTVGFVVLPIPLYSVIVSAPGFATILLIQLVLGVMTAMIAGVGPSAISELFPTNRRAMLVGLSSAVAITIFGGFAPFISTILIQTFGSPIAPAYYVVATAIFTGLTLLTVRETAHAELL